MSPRPAPALLLLLLVASLVVTPACRPPASTLPVIYPAPELALVDQRGAPFSSADAAGKVVVTNFVFTTCTDVCPLLTAAMASARDELRAAGLLGEKVLLLSISVDPEQDSPEALATYAERFGADPSNWRFLTGDRGQIESLLVTGYKVGAPPRAPSSAGGPSQLVHSNRFVVVDARGQIRWMPRGDELDVGQLVEEVRRLAA